MGVEDLSSTPKSVSVMDEKISTARSVDGVMEPKDEGVGGKKSTGVMQNYLVLPEPPSTNVHDTCLHQQRGYSTMPTP